MQNYEIPNVTIYRGENYPTPRQQFELAVQGGWFPTVKTLFSLHPECRADFEALLLGDPIGDNRVEQSSRQLKLNERLTEIQMRYEAMIAADGMNNNKRFAKKT